MSINNTTDVIFYIKTVYLGRHVSTFTRSSSGPQRTQMQDYTVLL